MNIDQQHIWAAGFLDGEGCFSIAKTFDKKYDKHRYIIRVAVSQKHEAPLKVLEKLFGGTTHFSPKQNFYQWAVQTKLAYRMCGAVLPYLVLKQQQAVGLISFQEDCVMFKPSRLETQDELREEYYLMLREMKK